MKFKTHSLLTLSLIFFLHFSSSAQQEKPIDSLIQSIENARRLFGVPGMAVGVIKDGNVVLNRGFGVRNTETGEAVDTETVFGIASCSKAFTAAALALLVDEGKLQWTDPVVDHYPDFKLSDPYITKEMQVQDLLCHRSGLQTFDGDLLWYGSTYSREEVLSRIQHREMTYSFRSEFGYQNVMYIAAGEVLERVSGKTWDQFLQDRIFIPLGMISSTTSNRDFDAGLNLAHPHIDGKPLPFLNYDNCGPAASINTSSDDLLHWVDLMLNKGRFNDSIVFDEQRYYELTAPKTLLNSGRGETKYGTHFYAYGMGWFLLDYEGRKIIQHGGGLPGFHSKVALVPEDGLGIVVVANQLSGLVEAVYRSILDFYLTDAPTDWVSRYRESEINKQNREAQAEQKKQEERQSDTRPSLELEGYAGSYADEMYGEASIEETDAGLKITLLPTRELFTSTMEHWEHDIFRIEFADPFLPAGYVHFEINEKNQVQGFTIDLKNPDFHFFKLHFVKND